MQWVYQSLFAEKSYQVDDRAETTTNHHQNYEPKEAKKLELLLCGVKITSDPFHIIHGHLFQY